MNDPVDAVLEMIVQAGHSRVPVYQENLDDIVGILYAKDLLPYLMPGAASIEQIKIRALARPAATCPRRSRSTSCCARCGPASATSRSWSTSTAAPPA